MCQKVLPPCLQPDALFAGKFRIKGQINKGISILARAEHNGIPVILKISDGTDSGLFNFLMRELYVLGHVRHDAIVRLLDAGIFENMHYLVLPDLGPTSLEDSFHSWGTLRPRLHLTALAQALFGLGELHRQGFVHRDLKPANIMLSEGGATVIDFGLVHRIGFHRPDASSDGIIWGQREGFLAGSPTYMSPEQTFPNTPIDGRSDVFSAGVVLYRILAGRRPFVAETIYEQVRLQRCERPPRIYGNEVPRTMKSLVKKALEKDPAHRFQTAEEMAGALLEYVHLLPNDAPDHTASVPALHGLLRLFARGR